MSPGDPVQTRSKAERVSNFIWYIQAEEETTCITGGSRKVGVLKKKAPFSSISNLWLFMTLHNLRPFKFMTFYDLADLSRFLMTFYDVIKMIFNFYDLLWLCMTLPTPCLKKLSDDPRRSLTLQHLHLIILHHNTYAHAHTQ